MSLKLCKNVKGTSLGQNLLVLVIVKKSVYRSMGLYLVGGGGGGGFAQAVGRNFES